MVTLGSCWHHFRHLGVPLGYFGPLLGQFGTTLSYSGGIWGPLLAYESRFGTLWGRFGVTLSSLWAHF